MIKQNNEDFRPIIPLKKNIEMSFNEDGIPLDPQLANQYYESFNDFEMDDTSPERKPHLGLSGKHTTSSSSVSSSKNYNSRNSLSKTVVPSQNNRRRRTNTAIPKRVVNPINNKLKITREDTHVSTESDSLPKGNGPVKSQQKGAKHEYEHLMDIQKTVVGNNNKCAANSQFGDDSQNGLYGSRIKQTKIHNLKT